MASRNWHLTWWHHNASMCNVQKEKSSVRMVVKEISQAFKIWNPFDKLGYFSLSSLSEMITANFCTKKALFHHFYTRCKFIVEILMPKNTQNLTIFFWSIIWRQVQLLISLTDDCPFITHFQICKKIYVCDNNSELKYFMLASITCIL